MKILLSRCEKYSRGFLLTKYSKNTKIQHEPDELKWGIKPRRNNKMQIILYLY